MISQTAEYALRAVVYLAERRGSGRTTGEMARATQIPAAYLSKVLQQLSRAAIVQSQRGLGGGFTLRTNPGTLSVLAVLNAVDPVIRIKECPLGLDEHATKLCSLHRRLDEAAAFVERAFGETTIADLIADPNDGNVCTFSSKAQEEKSSRRRKL